MTKRHMWFIPAGTAWVHDETGERLEFLADIHPDTPIRGVDLSLNGWPVHAGDKIPDWFLHSGAFLSNPPAGVTVTLPEGVDPYHSLAPDPQAEAYREAMEERAREGDNHATGGAVGLILIAAFIVALSLLAAWVM